ncbi:MAG: riboflavin biosynthesis protein RibF [Candidatus Omnitrophica bacterium]|nr:riboflavin biosynthesis protein RibF [Candidatus Omnitrophota bacterium]
MKSSRSTSFRFPDFHSMRLHRRPEISRSESERPLLLGLGNFDGVHLGHQALVKRVIASARGLKGLPALFTFPEHPQKILKPGFLPSLVTGLDQKLFLLEQMGITDVFLIAFTKAFSEISAKDFIRQWLVEKLNVQTVFMGARARFGYQRMGDAKFMEAESHRLGFSFEKIEPIRIRGKEVSSSRIREFLKKGKLRAVEEYLGRSYSVFGSVVKGSGRGRDLGFPTANLDTGDCLLPPEGVYPVRVRALKIKRKMISEGLEDFSAEPQGAWKEGVLNFGKRPTFEKAKRSVAEVFLLNWQGDLYGQTLEIVFYPQIREEKAFLNQETLIRQIEQDIEQARDYFRIA